MVRGVRIESESHDYKKTKEEKFPGAVSGEQYQSGQIRSDIWVR